VLLKAVRLKNQQQRQQAQQHVAMRMQKMALNTWMRSAPRLRKPDLDKMVLMRFFIFIGL
jgi:hypothetical protein